MADKDKKKKTKKKEDGKKEEAAAASPAATATPDPEPTPEKPATPAKSASETPKSTASSRASRGSRKVKRTGSSVFSMFTQKQVAEFKEAFQLMDRDKDGIVGKADLNFMFDQVGKMVTEKEIDDMLADAPGPLNFTQLLQMFAGRMQEGGNDDDETVIKAFRTFDNGFGKINGERFKHALITFGEKFTPKEANEAFDHMYIDDKGNVDIESLINMLTGTGEDDDD